MAKSSLTVVLGDKKKGKCSAKWKKINENKTLNKDVCGDNRRSYYELINKHETISETVKHD